MNFNSYKVAVSIFFGLLGFAVNFYPVDFMFYGTYRMSFLLGLVFPMLITLAWGWRYGLLSALAGGCQTMWILWMPASGFGPLVTVPPFTLWIVWHGTNLSKKYNIYSSELLFRIFNTAILYVFLMWAFSMNSPPANTYLPLEVVHSIVFKEAVNGVLIVFIAQGVLYTDLARRFFKLPKSTGDPRFYYTYMVAVILGAILVFSFVGETYIWGLWGTEFQYAARILGSVLLLLIGVLFTYRVANIFADKKAEDLVRVEYALRESEQKYRLLADNTLDVIWTMDLDTTFTYVNPAVFGMMEITPEEWVGTKLPEHCSTEDMQMIHGLIVNEIGSNEKREWTVFEAGFFNKDGKPIPCEVNTRIIFDENGMPVSIQGTTKDITERKVAEEELASTLLDLKRSNADLEQFAYVASHDLHEPIRMIQGYMRIIKSRYGDKIDDEDNLIGSVMDGTKRMQLLIDDLLKYSHVGMRDRTMVFTDCETMLEQVLSNLKTSIDDSGVVITHDPLPTVMADGSQLVHVFQNLICNSIKFKDGRPPRIHISAEKVGKMWEFSVEDNGIGIKPEFFDKIFVIFQRLHSTDMYSGTGMGLSICKKIVEQHGGRMWVESEFGEGSTFYFTV